MRETSHWAPSASRLRFTCSSARFQPQGTSHCTSPLLPFSDCSNASFISWFIHPSLHPFISSPIQYIASTFPLSPAQATVYTCLSILLSICTPLHPSTSTSVQHPLVPCTPPRAGPCLYTSVTANTSHRLRTQQCPCCYDVLLSVLKYG